MTITSDHVQQLRTATGAGIMDAKRALQEAGGDIEKAKDILRATGQKLAAKVESRKTSEGKIGEYVHTDGKSAALVAVACETDFVARTEDFGTLVHDLALHIVAMKPTYLDPSHVPADEIERETAVYRDQLLKEGKPEKLHDTIIQGKLKAYYGQICLLEQPFVKDDSKTISEVLKEYVARLGENIKITGFSRLGL